MSEQAKCACGSVLTAEEIQYYGHSCNACEQKELVAYLELMNKPGCAVNVSKAGYHRIKQQLTTLERQLSDRAVDYLALDALYQQALVELERVSLERDGALPLAKLGAWAISKSREDYSDVDGGDLQDMAEGLGVLVKVEVQEPCGEDCRCVEYYGSDFPVDCLRYSDAVVGYMESNPLPHDAGGGVETIGGPDFDNDPTAGD